MFSPALVTSIEDFFCLFVGSFEYCPASLFFPLARCCTSSISFPLHCCCSASRHFLPKKNHVSPLFSETCFVRLILRWIDEHVVNIVLTTKEIYVELADVIVEFLNLSSPRWQRKRKKEGSDFKHWSNDEYYAIKQLREGDQFKPDSLSVHIAAVLAVKIWATSKLPTKNEDLSKQAGEICKTACLGEKDTNIKSEGDTSSHLTSHILLKCVMRTTQHDEIDFSRFVKDNRSFSKQNQCIGKLLLALKMKIETQPSLKHERVMIKNDRRMRIISGGAIVERKTDAVTAKEKLAQLPVIDKQKVPVSFSCYSNHSPKVIKPSFDAQSLQTCGVWIEAWLEHAARQLQAVEQVFLPVCRFTESSPPTCIEYSWVSLPKTPGSLTLDSFFFRNPALFFPAFCCGRWIDPTAETNSYPLAYKSSKLVTGWKGYCQAFQESGSLTPHAPHCANSGPPGYSASLVYPCRPSKVILVRLILLQFPKQNPLYSPDNPLRIPKALKILSFVYFGLPQLSACIMLSVAATAETRSYPLAYECSTLIGLKSKEFLVGKVIARLSKNQEGKSYGSCILKPSLGVIHPPKKSRVELIYFVIPQLRSFRGDSLWRPTLTLVQCNLFHLGFPQPFPNNKTNSTLELYEDRISKPIQIFHFLFWYQLG
ncbi:hypothetical protein VP01_1812g2 [Puccinia sorghi]|uniref:Uncharacterized protein n=1 Tax=Puccinia sorghi TaxID=27349 RepID=A0A0L6VE22_9BASI|nr:hypothetical protein VP01_1812g2 [Puccinia sorghi]